jgi:hypothetical protein
MGMTCTMCDHEHKNADGTCECGCTGSGAKVCQMCNHEHKNADGSCECGCGKA